MKLEIPNTKYYKLCNPHYGDRYFSYWVSYSESNVEYHLDRWTYPKFGKLFVFKNLYDLGCYTDYRNNFSTVFMCEVINPVECRTAAAFINDLADYWRGVSVRTVDTPKGTYVCDGIKLIKSIK